MPIESNYTRMKKKKKSIADIVFKETMVIEDYISCLNNNEI